MSITFTFAPGQNQTFELRCEKGVRSLPQSELVELIDQCEQTYYSGRRKNSYGQFVDVPQDLVRFGQTLYGWLDGPQGWLRSQTSQGNHLNVYLNLDLPADIAALNADTQRVALGLAHLPWELLHDGSAFLMTRMEIAVLLVRQVQVRGGEVAGPQNRPLRLLFMATSPDTPGIAPLQYEAEEAIILAATQKQNQALDLVVEESGSVKELQSLVQSYEEYYFDVFHLTGHGFVYEGEPCFVTEDAYGQPVFSTAQDLARAFRNRWPRVVFLSGCHTGELPNEGTMPSMAAALIRAGAPAVLGWARPVYDRTAIVAAQALYQSLATANTVEEAVRAAQQEMIRIYTANADGRGWECSDWHLLRMYRDSREFAGLVTPLRTKGREKLRRSVAEKEFLDEKGEIKVASGAGFVGRRRPLQQCLRAMQETSEYVGVYLQGMGGLGKSTLAARVCRRVRSQRKNFKQVVIVGPLDELKLLGELSTKYAGDPMIPALLNQPQVSLLGRLRNFFEAIENELDKPLLLVLDDFEQNIPQRNVEDGSLRLTSTSYEILEAIATALAGGVSRLVITCRYYEATVLPQSCRDLDLVRLQRMNDADVKKKQQLIENENEKDSRSIEPETMTQIVEIADGNPRLLEDLTRAIAQKLASESLLLKLRETEEKFRENVLAEALIAALTPAERQGLARLSSVWLPVEMSLMPEMFWADAAEQSLSKLAGLGLVERAQSGTEPAAYRVSRILEPVLLPVLNEEEWQATYRAAVQELYAAWWEAAERSSESQRLEIVRLALLAKEQEIAAVVGDAVANSWYSDARFVESLEFCQQLLESFEDYRILGAIARSESVLGQTDDALMHYEKALELCPKDDLREKSITLTDMARVIAQQGDIGRALQLSQDSLDILERIGDVKGKAAMLSNMAGVIAQQGDIERALQLWQDSLDISERISDAQCKAATLSNLAGVTAQQGDIERALQLWQDSFNISERIGDVKGKAATLSNMAEVTAQQGDIERALQLWQDSLDILERISDVHGKAATLNNMAQVVAQQGDIERALQLWQDSLDIKERIGDVRGKATTLSNMAGVIAQQGGIKRAFQLWQDSLGILRRIGDVKGKAATLSNLAYWAGKTGDTAKQLELNLQAAVALGEVRAYGDLLTVLGNLGATDEGSGQPYLAQAIWLTLRIQAPFTDAITLLNALYQRIPKGDSLEALLGTTALFFCQTRGDNHPQQQQLQELSLKILIGAATEQGIDPNDEAALQTWMTTQRLNDPAAFLPQLSTQLETLIGETWAFDPTPLLPQPTDE
ncbi:MAG: tetratricopeptide repeat protein [Phormidesmis sp.]